MPKIVVKGKFTNCVLPGVASLLVFRQSDKYKENLRWGGGVL